MDIVGYTGLPHGAPSPGSNKAAGPGGQHPRGHHVSKACDSCRKKKGKCDGERPSCLPCTSAGTPCTWKGHDRRLGPAAEIKALQERVRVLEARDQQGRSQDFDNLIQALIGRFGSIDNVAQVLQNLMLLNPSVLNQATLPPASTPSSYVANPGERQPRLPQPSLPTEPQSGGGVHLAVPIFYRQRTVSTSSSDSGFASEASSIAFQGFTAATQISHTPRLSLTIPGEGNQTSLTPAPKSTLASDIPASAVAGFSPSPFAHPPTGGRLNVPVQHGWGRQRASSAASPSSSFISNASNMASSSTGQSFAIPIRGLQNPMPAPTIPSVANQVPPTPSCEQTPSSGVPDSGGSDPHWPHFAFPQGRQGGDSNYLPVPQWNRQRSASMSSSDSGFASETFSMASSFTGQGSAAAGPSDVATSRHYAHVNISDGHPRSPATNHFSGSCGDAQPTEDTPFDDLTQYLAWNGQA
ncbi:hypothetical protein AURDEDRAFT_178920 [Auricularia subglabra TFB-10046 SS5]|nr:hypothetical protein AURDEDRAFT_178920 [Auricularia subglabra TFB-10046 SS5]